MKTDIQIIADECEKYVALPHNCEGCAFERNDGNCILMPNYEFLNPNGWDIEEINNRITKLRGE